MARLFRKHFSDECLIAHLDGELPFYRRPLVRRHLAACWPCRLRLDEIEKQVLAVTRAMEKDAFPGPDRVVDARLRFLRAAEKIDAESASRPEPNRPAWAWRLGWTVACLVLLAGSWWLVREPAAGQPRIAASEVLKQAQSAEAGEIRGPVQQEFRVVARQLRPRQRSSESHLEVWSEPATGRFVSRLSGDGGVLRHAVWHPAPNRSYVYNPSRRATVVKWSRQQARERWADILSRDGLTLEDLEAGLLTWLEDRPWQPISLSSEVSLMATAGGAALKAERVRSDAGRDILRLSAWRTVGAVSIGFILEVDGGDYHPRLQCIRYESPARTLELWLYPEPVRTARAVSYEPPTVTSAVPQPLPLYPQPRVPQVSLLPFQADDPVLVEMEVYYALHRVRACLGESVEVIRQPGRGFEVRGVVVDAGRKEQIAAALAPLAGPLVSIDVKSVQEALGDLGPGGVKVVPQPPLAAQPRKEVVQFLARYFAKDEKAAARFADRALSESEDLVFEAQALRQLAASFPSEAQIESPRARWLLQVMTYDHLSDLRAKLESAWQLVGPPLEAAAGPGLAVPSDATAQGDDGFDRIFKLTRLLNDRLRSLFSKGGAEPQTEGLIREVLGTFPALQASTRQASDKAAAAYAGPPQQ
jgi:hypothetical protein